MAILEGRINLVDRKINVTYLCDIATCRMIEFAWLTIPWLSRALTECSEAEWQVSHVYRHLN
jgi:hypothetical protein